MFEGLDPLLRNVARRELTATPGEKVVFQDDPVRYAFFIIAGAIELVRHQASGAPLIIHALVAAGRNPPS
jgi:hypothetical protein